jgi:calcium/calmodulin-dependent protein kinase (CaM kinase) II
MNEHEHEYEHEDEDEHEDECEEAELAQQVAAELLDLSQQLLDAIANGDWKTYEQLCDPSLSCFEPEARGHMVEGLEFHKFYFDLSGPNDSLKLTTMVATHVRLMGEEAAVVSYVRLNQRVSATGEPHVTAVEETRVWERIEGQWKHVHVHRSPAP